VEQISLFGKGKTKIYGFDSTLPLFKKVVQIYLLEKGKTKNYGIWLHLTTFQKSGAKVWLHLF